MKILITLLLALFIYSNVYAQENTKAMRDKTILEDGKVLHVHITNYEDSMRKTFYVINEREYYICVYNVFFSNQFRDTLICTQKDIDMWGGSSRE
jgi:hypothetical protein